jgi:hypothetical protein
LEWFIAWAPRWLVPSLRTEPRPTHHTATLYVRSFMTMRTLSGVLGIALPVVLVGIAHALSPEDPFFRGSLSEYYYTGAREWFVGVLSATAVFLIAYKVFEWSLDNLLSLGAAISAILVLLFPTGRPVSHDTSRPAGLDECTPGEPVPTDWIDCTPIQESLGERRVEGIHFAAAATFIGLIGVITFFFGVREARRRGRRRLSQTFWRRWHFTCALAIAGGILWIVGNELAVKFDLVAADLWHPVLVGEVVAVWAFAASWISKGLDIDYLAPQLFGKE